MRSAIVGCGGIAQVHAKCLSALAENDKNIELVAVCDCKKAKAEEMAERYGVSAYESLEEMLSHENIDVLHICTPHYLHTPMAVQALDKGISVFLEKPPAINQEQWEELKEAVRRNKGRAKLGLCLQNRFNESVRYVKDALNQGKYGKILGARGIVTWHRMAEYYQDSDWRGRLASEGGGVLINQSVHTLDLLQYFIGEHPKHIEAVMDQHHLPGIVEVEDTMAAYIEYPTARATFYATSAYVTDAPVLIELECEKARIRIEDLLVTVWEKDEQGSVQAAAPASISFSGENRYGKSYWGNGHLCCIESFYDCLENGKTFMMEPEKVEDTVWLMLQAYESARSKEKGEK